ncbi:MAG: hypothetical protein MJA27_25425 [Pseudanabaenales cyanobacterium]|nr:hypothetical protein [Pseudanabaenales cyanobacterium]
MKDQLFLSVMTAAAFLTGVSADNVTSVQSSEARLIASANEISINEWCNPDDFSPADIQQLYAGEWLLFFEYELIDGLKLTPEQRQFIHTEIAHHVQALTEMFEQAEAEGHDISDAKFQAVSDEFFSRLEQNLSPAQIQQGRDNFDQIYNLSPEESLWAAEMQQALFEEWFAGIELTPKQEQFVRAEITRYNQVSDEAAERAYEVGRDLTEEDFQVLDNNFFARLEQGLNSEQIQQMQDNFDQIYNLSPEEEALWEDEMQQILFEEWFAGIELTPKQEQFVRAELTRYNQVADELPERVYETGRSLTEDDFQAVEDEFFARLKQGLSPEQIQQAHFNFFWAPLCNTKLELQYFELLFEGIKLTPEEEQFAQVEMFRYDQVFNELDDRAYEEDRGLTNAEIQALDDELYRRLGQGLNPSQIQQLRENLERIQVLLESLYPDFS